MVLNLAEGWGKRTKKDREKFFTIAFGSIREMQAIADMEIDAMKKVTDKLDHLAASVYKLSGR